MLVVGHGCTVDRTYAISYVKIDSVQDFVRALFWCLHLELYRYVKIQNNSDDRNISPNLQTVMSCRRQRCRGCGVEPVVTLSHTVLHLAPTCPGDKVDTSVFVSNVSATEQVK